ncbi:MAG: tetratricopeptide repeat protein [Sedimentisphaerales bacterium]|nr:tetratricopeptide repeat protein [Sedimentisphaerales bacterium]
MSRRRLNKKVALIGSTIFLLLSLGAVAVILKLSRNPAPFIADGDAAKAAADYESARRSYGKALGLTRSPQDKIDLYFKLADVFTLTQDWRSILGCWQQIVTADPQNLRARVGRLKYAYILADSLSGVGQSANEYWAEVLKQTAELMEVARSAGALDEPVAQWEPSFGAAEEPRWAGGIARLGPRLHFIQGRAALEMASLGSGTSPDDLLEQAQGSLEKSREMDPNNPDVYYYLAQVVLRKGESAASRGNLEQRQVASKRAEEILSEGVKATGGAALACVNLVTRKFAVARTAGVAAARTRMEALQPEYQKLTETFPQSANVFAATAEFHSVYSAYLGPAVAAGALNRAIEAVEKAGTLDRDNVLYARFASRLCYRKYSLFGDEPALLEAIETAERAMKLPDAQDTPGPRQYARQAVRLSLCSFLTGRCVERILTLDRSSPQRAEMLAKAEEAVHEIEQIRGSGQNPQVVMWQGMLDLAKGNTSKAIRNLYAAYEQLKASGAPQERDPFLSYTLANIFQGTPEIGAVIEFLGSALGAGAVEMKPSVLLDYAEALLQAKSYDMVLNAVGVFDERFGATDRSKVLRTGALIAKGHIPEAEEAISRLSAQDPNTLRLGIHLARAKAAQLRNALRQERTADGQSVEGLTTELHNCEQQQVDLTLQLLTIAPAVVEERDVTPLCESLLAQKEIAQAGRIVDAFLKRSPHSVEMLSYKGLLAEPDPSNCPEPRRREIREQAIRGIEDPVRRSIELGLFYQQQEQWDRAAAQWRDVLDATTAGTADAGPAYLRARQPSPRHEAASYLFDLARRQRKWALAEEMAKIAKQEDLDDCGGYLFAARLAFARGENKDALSDLGECLKQRPIFSYGYMLRGNVQTALGNQLAAIADIKKAASLNPIDPLVAKVLANALYVRNAQLGDKASSEQELEAKQAVEQAIQLEPRDVSLLSAYAEMIGKDDPMKALALYQTMQVNAPSVTTAVMLGRLATQVALKETDAAKKQTLLALAESAFEQARKMEPGSQFMLENYAQYYRARGEDEKASQLLAESRDNQLLWRHYIRVGRFEEARKLLLRMYDEPASRVDALKGLVLIAEQTGEREDTKKYSQELLALEDNPTNRAGQIRAYLAVGLVEEAQVALTSFKAKYPDEPRIGLMEALLAKRRGDLDRALELVNRSLQSDQENASAWRLHGEIAFLKGDYDQAVTDLKKSRSLEDDVVTTTMLARAYLWAGRSDEAIAELKGILDKPGTPGQARQLLESIYQRLGRNDALRQLYTDTLAQDPENVEWLSRAGAFAINQREYARAEELYEKAYKLQQQVATDQSPAEVVRRPRFTAALDGYLLSLILGAGEPGAAWHPEKLSQALDEGGKYVDTPYGAAALCRMAEAEKKLGDVEATRDYCQKAVDRAWTDEQMAVEVLLRVYLLLGGDEVSKYCNERLRTNPDSLPANYTMFHLAKLKEDYDGAVDYIDTCIALCPPDAERRAEYMAQRAQILVVAHEKTSDNKYLEKAIGAYESLLEKTPKNSNDVVLNNLAYMLACSNQRLADALQYVKEALQQKPDEASYLDTYAYVLHKNGRNDEAIRSLTAAIRQYETRGAVPPDVYEHLGMVYEAVGDGVKALAAYRRALEVGTGTMPRLMKDRIDAAVGRLTQ